MGGVQPRAPCYPRRIDKKATSEELVAVGAKASIRIDKWRYRDAGHVNGPIVFSTSLEFAMNNLLSFIKKALHATAFAILVATTLTACGGDNSGPAGSAVDNSASSTPANGG